jgi:hypothetical protein
VTTADGRLPTDGEAGAPPPWTRDLLQPLTALREHALDAAASLVDASAGEGRREAALHLLLLVCAAEQVSADHLLRGTLDLGPVAAALDRRRLPTWPLTAAVGAGGRLRALRAAAVERPTVRLTVGLRDLALRLAVELAGGPGAPWVEAVRRAFTLPDDLSLARRRLKIPSCFRAQDIAPADCFELARRVAAEAPSARRVTVVGVRTSGSYLAPLCAGWLAARGVDAQVVTLRPRAPLPGWERRRLRAHRPDAVLVVDDPPQSGASLAAVARQVEGCGVPRSRVTLLIPGVAGEQAAATCARHRRIELARPELSAHRRLRSPELAAWVASLTGREGAAVTAEWSAEEVAERAGRGHVEQRFHVEGGGAVVVRGIGTGWFGDPARHAARALAGHVPEVLGVRDGLMASRLVEGPSPAPGDGAAVDAMARYVAVRQRRLGVPWRPPLPDGFRKDGWYRLAKVLARAHGPLAPLRTAAVRELLREAAAARPGPECLVDGWMARTDWVTVGGHLLKRTFAEHAFDKDDVDNLDPAGDLAGLVLEMGPSRELEARAVARYVDLTGDAGVAERLGLAKLLAAALRLERLSWDLREAAAPEPWRAAVGRWLEAEAAMTWTVDGLLADAYAAAWTVRSGPLWSLDVDGVLEDAGLGVPAATPAAAIALRRLRDAGATVVLNTGRSLDEVRLRCDALRLDGGVAEYGAVVWDATSGHAETLLSPAGHRALDRVREAAATLPGVHVDGRYRHAVRLRALRNGRLRRLDGATLDRLLAAGGPGVEAVQGSRQSDVVSTCCNKGTGLARLAALLDAGGPVIAAGDSAADLPALRAAARAYAPRHHDRRLDPWIGPARGDRQRVLLEAVRREHGRCDPAPSPLARPAEVALARLLGWRDRSRLARALAALGPTALDVFRA